MSECKRCGQCCYYIMDGERKKCRFLIRTGSNTTLCRIYSNRLGKIIDLSKDGITVVRCSCRSDDLRIFLGCPLNKK